MENKIATQFQGFPFRECNVMFAALRSSLAGCHAPLIVPVLLHQGLPFPIPCNAVAAMLIPAEKQHASH